MAESVTRSPTEAERRRIQEIIEEHDDQRPAGVRRVDFKFGEDWTGYPAVFLWVYVDKDLQLTKKKDRRAQ